MTPDPSWDRSFPKLRSLTCRAFSNHLFAAPAGAATFVDGKSELGSNSRTFTTVYGGNSSAIAGWTVGGSSTHYIASYWMAREGNRSVDLARSDDGSISRAIATIIGQCCDASYWIARHPGNGVSRCTGFIDVGGVATQLAFNGVGSIRTNRMWEKGLCNFTARSTNSIIAFLIRSHNIK